MLLLRFRPQGVKRETNGGFAVHTYVHDQAISHDPWWRNIGISYTDDVGISTAAWEATRITAITGGK